MAFPQNNQVYQNQIIEKLDDWLSKVNACSYTLKEYSEINPQTYFSLVYRESADAYYAESKIVSSEADRIYRGNIISWDGSRAMRLRQDTGLLYVNSKPYRLPNEFRNLNGIWSPFRFMRRGLSTDDSRYPSLQYIQQSIKEKRFEVILETKEGKTDNGEVLVITTEGGIDLMDDTSISIRTTFSVANKHYPISWELLNSNKKVKSKHLVEGLSYYDVPNSSLKIPYPGKLRSIYYTDKGIVSNTVISEFSNVSFNSSDSPGFEMDPAFAKKIVDEANGNKLINVPK